MADVLPPQGLNDSPFGSSSPGLRRSGHSQTSLLLDTSRHHHSEQDSKRLDVDDKDWLSSSGDPSRNPSTDVSLNSSFTSTPASSLSIETTFLDDTPTPALTYESYDSPLDDSDDYQDEFEYTPSIIHAQPDSPPPSPNTSKTSTFGAYAASNLNTPLASQDDTAVHKEPSQHVDYLSHDWREEDLWSSWRHIVSQRKVYGQSSRFENASWRSWAKQKHNLPTLNPSALNWLKDVDVTWLYGPFKTANDTYSSSLSSEVPSRLSRTNSYINKKPILKKRSMSEVMLQRSISTSSLLKQAAMAVQEQRHRGPIVRDASGGRPGLGRSISDFTHAARFVPVSTSSTERSESQNSEDYFTKSQSVSTSGHDTPEESKEKHIRFDDTVEQCIAVESEEDTESIYSNSKRDPFSDSAGSDEDSDDEGLVMMKPSRKNKTFSHSSTFPHPHGRSHSASASRSVTRGHTRSNSVSTSNPKITIEKLPATRLKYRVDSPDIPDGPFSGGPLRLPSSRSLEQVRSQSSAASHSTGQRYRVSPYGSQETLRPAHPSKNFLLAEEDLDELDRELEKHDSLVSSEDSNEDDEEEEDEEHSSRPAYARRDSIAVHRKRGSPGASSTALSKQPPAAKVEGGPLRRTESGRLLPGGHHHTGEESEFGEAEFEAGFEEEGDEGKGVFGRVVDTVNTVRDIAYVVWNVGWRK